MEPPTGVEAEHLAALKSKPVDFESWPPVLQTQHFVEYLLQRGDRSFSPRDIQNLFRVADLHHALSGKPNCPAPSVLRRYINKAVAQGKFALDYDETSDVWRIRCQKCSVRLDVETDATDRLQAKDVVARALPIFNRIRKESVTPQLPWVVTLEFSPRYCSRPAVLAEMTDFMAMVATQWTVNHNSDGWTATSSAGLIRHCTQARLTVSFESADSTGDDR